LTFSGKFSHIIEFINIFIIWVFIKISFKVVSILLLLLSKSTEEEGVVLVPAFVLAFEHSTFTSIVALGVVELSSIELLDSVEVSVEHLDVLLHFIPLFKLVSAIRSGQESSLSGHLLINSLVGKMHSVEFLMSLRDSF